MTLQPPAAVFTSLLALSTDGQRLAISKLDSSNLQRYSIALIETAGMTQIAETSGLGQYQFGSTAAFVDDGKSIAVMAPYANTLEFYDAETLQLKKQLPLERMGMRLAASDDGKLLAIANWDSISLYDGGSVRELVEYQSSGGVLPLLIALGAAVVFFAALRQRRKWRTCVQCGKRWIPVDRLPSADCPDCRVLGQTTAEISAEIRKRKRRRWQPWAAIVVIDLAVALWLSASESASPNLGRFIAWLIAIPFIFLPLLIALALVILRIRIRRLRKFCSPDFSLATARKVAGSEGHVDEFGPITIWTDADAGLLPISAESITAELDDCRRRLEELAGEPCAPARPLLLLFFNRTAAANGYLPAFGQDADQQGFYLGPWADQGFVSLEMLRRRLTLLRPMVRSLLLLHLRAAGRGMQRFWLKHGLDTYLSDYYTPAKRDAWRRIISVFNQEGELLPLACIFKQPMKALFRGGSAAMLPESFEGALKIRGQLSSLVDYLCGEEAPPERRQEFVRLWQAVQETGAIEKACQATVAGGLAQLESDWKAWAAAATFGLPVPPPSEVAAAAEKEVIPLARDAAAPLQERIKRIRSLGACGWSVGIDPLQELMNDPQPDIRRESKRALQLLSGSVEVQPQILASKTTAKG